MQIQATVEIRGTREAIWDVITDIDHSADTIGGIESVEVLARPEAGLVGLKWRETRTLFGRTATEVMWITDAVDGEYYRTRAENHGAVYLSELRIGERAGTSTLTMSFQGIPQGLVAKIMVALTGFMVKGATQKAIQSDLQDIKRAVEEGQG